MMNGVKINVVERNGTLRAQTAVLRISQRTDLPQNASGPAKSKMDEYEIAGYNWAPWGVNDDVPNRIQAKLEQVPLAYQTIYKLAQMLYGNGLAYYRRSDVMQALEAGEALKIKRAYVPVVEEFLRRNRIASRWYMAQAMDYRVLINSFSELIYDNDRRLITGLYHKEALFSRLSKQNQNNLRIEYLIYSKRFGFEQPREDELKKIPLYQWDDEAAFFERLRGTKFAWHTCFPMPGVTYYPKAPWLGLFRKNGWMDTAISVPEVVNAMMHNQIRLKYQILIHINYLKEMYPEWDNYDARQRDLALDRIVKKIDDSLVGTTNAYKSITNVFGTNALGQEIGKVEIVSIDDKVKNDQWVPSATAANAEIVTALGGSNSMMELAPDSGKIGGGSGSDKREIFNTIIGNNTVEQDILLEPLNFVMEYNARTNPDWDVVFFIDHTSHTTSNLRENGMQPASTTLQTES
jgi:hypothetical protein